MPYNSPIPERKTQSKPGIGFQSLVQAEKLMQIAFVLPSAMVIGWLPERGPTAKLHQSWLTIVGDRFSGVFRDWCTWSDWQWTQRRASAAARFGQERNGSGDAQ